MKCNRKNVYKCIKFKLEGLWGHNVEPVTRHEIEIFLLSSLVQKDSRTIDGNVKFVLSVQLYSDVTSVNKCPTKLLIIVMILE